MDSDLDKKKVKNEFNNFLDTLSMLVEKTKIIYFIVTKNALRDDIELSIIKDKIKNYSNESEKLAVIRDELETSVSSVKDNIAVINNAHENATNSMDQILEWQSQSNSIFKEISKVHDSIEGWDEDIQEKDTQYRTLSEQMTTLTKESRQLCDTLDKHTEIGEKTSKNLIELQKANESLKEEIQQTLGDANRVGMAASFKERKNELKLFHWTWQAIFVASLVAIVVLSYRFFYKSIIDLPTDSIPWPFLIMRIAMLAPLVWLAWFAAKQFTYVNRIREDYAFKYAASMAYEGHKKATREVGHGLEKVLLEFSLFNMSQNPIRLYTKNSEHTTPLQEMAAIVLEKLPELKEVTAKIPSIGNVTFHLKENDEKVDEDDNES